MRLCICTGAGGEANLPQTHTKSPPATSVEHQYPPPSSPSGQRPARSLWLRTQQHPNADQCSLSTQHGGSDIPKAPTRLLNPARDHHCAEGGIPPGTRMCPKGDPKHPLCTHSILGAEPRCGALADPPPPGLTSAGGCCGTPSCSTGGHHQRGPGCAGTGGTRGSPGAGQLLKPKGRRGPPSACASCPGGKGKAGTEERLWFRRTRRGKDVMPGVGPLRVGGCMHSPARGAGM